MNSILLTTTWFVVLAHTLGMILAIVSALAVSSALKINKGAKANRAWMLIAAGLLLVGLSEGGRLLTSLDLSYLEGWDNVVLAAGLFLVLLGTLDRRALLKKMLK